MLLLNLQSFCGLFSVIFCVSLETVAFDICSLRKLICHHRSLYLRAEFCVIGNVVGVLQKENLCNKWWMKLSIMSQIKKVSFFLYALGLKSKLEFVIVLLPFVTVRQGLTVGVFFKCRGQKY